MVLRLLSAGAALIALASCYTPPVTASCEVRCSTGDTCPEGLECNLTDRFCHRPDEPDSCPPPDGAALARIGAGDTFTCGLDPDHQLWCWGRNTFGQIGVGSSELHEPAPRAITAAGVTGWSDFAADGAHACAIAEPSGALYCWGADNDGQLGAGPGDDTTPSPTTIAEPGPWSDVVAGDTHTCAIKNGELWCWGANYAGQVGDNDPGGTVDSPTRIGDGEDWTAIDASYSHTCGLRDAAGTRTLYCWGDDIGLGITPTPTAPVPAPAEVAHPIGTRSWIAVTTGSYFTCAIDDTAALWCWGIDDNWQLGDGTAAVEEQPALVDEELEWTAVSAGDEHVCAIAGTALSCWGRSEAGQTGVRDVRVAGGAPLAGAWASVDAGLTHTCAIDMDGEGFCWGDNGDAQLGTGEVGDAYAPRLVDDTRAWSEVSAGATATCGIVEGGLECWGLDIEELFGAPGDRARPAPIAHPELAPLTWSTIEVGSLHACAITDDQLLWCWGRGDEAQLGDGAQVTPNDPVVSDGVWTDVAVGSLYSCAITGGNLWCFGYDEMGRTGDLAAHQLVVLGYQVPGTFGDVSVGNRHTCAVATDGSAQCWGHNRCNVVHPTEPVGGGVAPTAVPGTSWTTIEASWDDYQPFNLGLAGTAASGWGCADSGRLGNGDPLTDQTAPDALALGGWTALSVGGPMACGLRGVGELYCWGDGSYGARGDGSDVDVADPIRIMDPTTGWQRVSVGLRHVCAIDVDARLWCWGDNSAMQLGQGLGMTTVPQAVVLPE